MGTELITSGVCSRLVAGPAVLFPFFPGKACINRTGWLSLVVIVAFGHIFSSAVKNKRLSIHFWPGMIGVLLLLSVMNLFGLGKFQIAGSLTGIGGILILTGVSHFVIMVMNNIKVQIAS